MEDYMKNLEGKSRLLVSVELKPLQGTRFQPTGFMDIGAATYDAPDGTKMLLVESTQSMANRMEAVCWDTAKNELVEPLKGLSYVAVSDKDKKPLTNSILEAHRLNSPYINDKKSKMLKVLKELPQKPDMKQFVTLLMKYDVGALLHGIFISRKEIAGGRYRLSRALSAFVEAKNVKEAVSGGVKLDLIDAKGQNEGDENSKGDSDDKKKPSEEGRGNIPYPRSEYTGNMTAYFSLDLAQIRSYGLGEDAEKLLVALALFKIRKVLNEGLRFRTACDLKAEMLKIDAPAGFKLPLEEELAKELPHLIKKCEAKFAGSPSLTEIYELGKGEKREKKPEGEDDDNEEDAN